MCCGAKSQYDTLMYLKKLPEILWDIYKLTAIFYSILQGKSYIINCKAFSGTESQSHYQIALPNLIEDLYSCERVDAILYST